MVFLIVNGNLDTITIRLSNKWQNDKSNDTVTLWDKAPEGCTCFITGEGFTSVPSATTEWRSAIGFLLKRTPKEGCIVLFGYSTGRIAILSNSNGTWGSWVIK